MGNAPTSHAVSTSTTTDEGNLQFIIHHLEPLCVSRRLGRAAEVDEHDQQQQQQQDLEEEGKNINPQTEEELIKSLKQIQKSAASGKGSNGGVVYVPGWNDSKMVCTATERQAKNKLLRILLDNDHQVNRTRWRSAQLTADDPNYEAMSLTSTIHGTTVVTARIHNEGTPSNKPNDDHHDFDNDTEQDSRTITSSYMEALVECLYYQPNLEMQLVAANIITELCGSLVEEVEADLQPVHADGGQSSKHYDPLTQCVRFRFGMTGAIPPLILLTYQGQHDLQLLGTRGLAGLAMHPGKLKKFENDNEFYSTNFMSLFYTCILPPFILLFFHSFILSFFYSTFAPANRAAIATLDGLRPLVIHTLSHDVLLRVTSVLALNRLTIQPRQRVPTAMYALPMDPLSIISTDLRSQMATQQQEDAEETSEDEEEEKLEKLEGRGNGDGGKKHSHSHKHKHKKKDKEEKLVGVSMSTWTQNIVRRYALHRMQYTVR